MDLRGSAIIGDGIRIPITEGAILETFRNRRNDARSAPPPGVVPRRRKAPMGLEEVEPSKVWVVNGHFSLKQSDTSAWSGKGAMRVEAQGMMFYVVTLRPVLLDPDSDMMIWEFRALCVPTPDQLNILPVLPGELDEEPIAASAPSDPLIDFLEELKDTKTHRV